MVVGEQCMFWKQECLLEGNTFGQSLEGNVFKGPWEDNCFERPLDDFV